jgi:hypothetical protein
MLYVSVTWTELAIDCVKWWSYVNTVMNLFVKENAKYLSFIARVDFVRQNSTRFGLKKTIIREYNLLKENSTLRMYRTFKTLKYLGYKSP